MPDGKFRWEETGAVTESSPMIDPQFGGGLPVVVTAVIGLAHLHELALEVLGLPPPAGLWVTLAIVARAAGLTTWCWSLLVHLR